MMQVHSQYCYIFIEFIITKIPSLCSAFVQLQMHVLVVSTTSVMLAAE